MMPEQKSAIGGLRDLFESASSDGEPLPSVPPRPVAPGPVGGAVSRSTINSSTRAATRVAKQQTSLRLPSTLLEAVRARRWGYEPLTLTGLLAEAVVDFDRTVDASVVLGSYAHDHLVARSVSLDSGVVRWLDQMAAEWRMSRSRAATVALAVTMARH